MHYASKIIFETRCSIMLTDKNDFLLENVTNLCLQNILNGNYRYVTRITLNRADLDNFNNWLIKCESLSQDYILMYFKTDNEYSNIFGFSSFRIPDLYDSKADFVNLDNRDENELNKIISMWFKFCSCIFISENTYNNICISS